jgi:hypothetical protein
MAAFVGRHREIGVIERLLDRAESGAGAVLAVVGPPGAGKTALLDVAAAAAQRRGLAVLRGSPDPIENGEVAFVLEATRPQVVLLDDLDQGGVETRKVLSILAAGVGRARVAVIATSCTPLRIGEELRLGPLSEEELATALGVG